MKTAAEEIARWLLAQLAIRRTNAKKAGARS
jgi:hypothetical protein